MSRKITPVLFALGAVLLAASQVAANPLFRFTEIPALVTVPEVDFRDLGSVGIGTAIMAAGYVARKAYLKVTGRQLRTQEALTKGFHMSRKILFVLSALAGIALVTGQAAANPLFHFFEPSVAPVPEVDFRDLGSVGIGTAVMAAGYVARKAYQKITGRKRD